MSDEDMVVEEEENLHPNEKEDSNESDLEIQDKEQDEPSLESLKAELKKSRWNVFLFLGVALIMFGFALFPMSVNIDYDNLWGTSEKDIGFVWGPSTPGEDFMDVPFELEIKIVNAPSTTQNITLEAFVLKTDDCQDSELSELEALAREGENHDYQFQSITSPLEGESYNLYFDLDMGQYCAKIQFVDDEGNRMKENANIDVKGKLWPNQVLAGIPGLIFLGISIFGFIGAQKKGSKLKEILENLKVSDEQLVLEAAAAEKIAQGPAGPPQPSGPTGPPQTASGPSGPPQSTVGPSGPPQSAKRSGPAQVSIAAETTESTRSGPPPVAEEFSQSEVVEPTEYEPQIEEESTFEPAGNGYFYRKMADGSYEQIIYVQSEDGNYIPYEQ